jgi:uroporphyrinogen III methyltransferase/synthase
MKPPPQHNRVYLVGAGPGDPGLLTLRGAACLRQAQVVVYDYLVDPAVLALAPPEAEKVCLGQHGTGRMIEQDEVNRMLVEYHRRGATVVRLKGGDPSIFGRGAEETAALDAAGIPWEVVPGVTAAVAAAGYAAIPITHSQLASAVAVVTGRERGCKHAPALDYAALARFPGTLVFYMGVTTAAEWSTALMAAGKPPQTPVAIVRRCTWTDQRTFRCTLGTVAETIAAESLRPPAVIIVGEVVDLAPAASWFTARPLFGRRVLVTRPRHQAAGLAEPLAELGAEVHLQPVIEIGPPADWAPVDAALKGLDQFAWLVFSSANGVSYFLDRLESVHGDLRRLGAVKLAAIGPGTAEELQRYRLQADLVPGEYRAEALADALARDAAGKRFLLIRASRGRAVLGERLQAVGAVVREVVAYQSTDLSAPDAAIARQLAERKIDWITVTSSAIARSLVRLFGADLKKARLASISPVTSETLVEAGFPPQAEASEYTMPGLAQAIASKVSGTLRVP